MEYRTLIDRVGARAGLSPEHASRLTRAVLRTLAERIDIGEATDLAGLLPEQLRGYLVDERISAERFPLSEFVQRVAVRAEANRAIAEKTVPAVLEILHDAVGDIEWAQLMAQLPLDFRELVETGPRRPPAGAG